MQPLVVFVGLSAFVIYSTWAAFQGGHYYADPYLSPFYSPLIFGPAHGPGGAHVPHAWFGEQPKPGWYPGWLAWSAAMWILWGPAGFRFTCYYYRGAYYKAFWADPPSCSVGEPRKSYWGEARFPLIIQNIHRYFFYVATFFLIVLAWDVWEAFWFDRARGAVVVDPTGHRHFGVGLGTIILLVNVILLGCYTFGCHSFRHLVGGFRDRLSRNKASYAAYRCSTCLNRRHMLYAWCSLFTVGFADIYVRLCAHGIWHDWRIF